VPEVSLLVEKRNELAAKQAEIIGIHEKHPDLRFSEDERKRLTDLAGELTETKTEVDALVELETSAKMARGLGELITGKSGGQAMPGGFPGVEEKGQLVDPYTGQPISQKTLGLQFIDSPAFKDFSASRREGPDYTFKAPPGFLSKTTLTETGYAPQAIRTGMVLPTAVQRPTVSDLLPQGRTDQVAIVYMEETTATNAAAATAETVALPESALAFTERNAPVQTVGTFLPVTNQLMSDAPAMSSYIDQRLRLFLQIAEDLELLSGSGTPPHVRGLLNATNLQTQATGTDSALHAILKAMTKIHLSTFLPATGLLINPLDWQNIRLLQTTVGNFVLENPGDPNFFERIWGLPVVQTTAISAGTALVGAFDSCAQMFRREDMTMAVSDSHSTFFTQRMLAIRVDERFALAIYRGAGFCQVTGLPQST
jgi:HK97 family phage major capsid protein